MGIVKKGGKFAVKIIEKMIKNREEKIDDCQKQTSKLKTEVSKLKIKRAAVKKLTR